MAEHVIWLIAGFVLVIAELVSGTFYLLVLGIAAFAGAAVAWAGLGLGPQSISAAVVAAAGVAWVYRWRKGTAKQQMPPLDVGQIAVFDCWVSEEARHARVRYRDTLWDGLIEGTAEGKAGEIFYIVAVQGNTLQVSKSRPA